MDYPYISLWVLWSFDDQKFKWWGEKNQPQCLINYIYPSIPIPPEIKKRSNSVNALALIRSISGTNKRRDGTQNNQRKHLYSHSVYTTIKQSEKKRMWRTLHRRRRSVGAFFGGIANASSSAPILSSSTISDDPPRPYSSSRRIGSIARTRTWAIDQIWAAQVGSNGLGKIDGQGYTLGMEESSQNKGGRASLEIEANSPTDAEESSDYGEGGGGAGGGEAVRDRRRWDSSRPRLSRCSVVALVLFAAPCTELKAREKLRGSFGIRVVMQPLACYF